MWDGDEWKEAPGPGANPNKKLYAITCTSDNSCWAVGENKTFIYYDGNEWALSGAIDDSVENKSFKAIACSRVNNCWAAAGRSNGPVMAAWDGVSWKGYDTSYLENTDTNALAALTIERKAHSPVYVSFVGP